MRVSGTCPSCGNQVMLGARFCGDCGFPLDPGEHTSPTMVPTMVSFPDAIRLGFERYFDFRGRSTRAEFWWWALFVILVGLVFGFIDGRMGSFNLPGFGLFSGLFRLATLIPGLALGARRLHDINRTGWWQLLWIGLPLLFIPVIPLLFWAAKRGDVGANKYGPHRLEVVGESWD